MNKTELILYKTQDSDITIDVLVENETVWLTQSQMGMLFGRNKSTISNHIINIFKEGELAEEVVVRKNRTTTQHGAMTDKTQDVSVNIYNLT